MSLLFGDDLNNENNMFGLHMNYSWNNMTNLTESEAMANFNLGLFFTHKFENNWQLNVDMLAKYRRGASGIPAYDLGDENLNDYYGDIDFTRSIKYLSLPITMRYELPKRVFLELGPQVSFRLKAIDEFEAELPQGDITLDVDIRDEVQRFDFGYVAGIGWFFDKESLNAIGFRYNGGFTDVMKNDANKQAHQQWGFFCNLPIGRGKIE
ncbi:porin family protein [Algoriphagus halophytocola]|uniref:PorT family protein n=1 Tax=Algoriphagus halophytocola TaxID=2991499 RepID=A0ABY6MHX9_9BACT|nr:porin family protein [Algoriphagus sp. TR-M5]UZD21789.1 PorT family protein [Algoriphagus sp. TR-M5]